MGTGNRPALKLAPRLAATLTGRQIHLTLSHSRDIAMAAVLVASDADRSVGRAASR